MAKIQVINNLIDFDAELALNPDYYAKPLEIFHKMMAEIFFFDECDDKNVSLFVNNLPLPSFMNDVNCLREVKIPELQKAIYTEMVHESFAALVYFSPKYLKAFYSKHQPDFSKLPSDIQLEVVEKVKQKNEQIINAFLKMHDDMQADKERTVLKQILLIIRNIYLRTGFPLLQPDGGIEKVIRDLYPKSDEIFSLKPAIINDVRNEQKLKELVREVFRIKSAKDIKEMAVLLKKEVERYEKRAPK